MDPVGNIAAYQSLVKGQVPRRQHRILMRELLIALAFMLLFNEIGEFIFDYLHLSETTLRISSGVILFLIAIKILFTAPDSLRSNLPHGEPFIFPLAVPLIAGPGLLATIMLFAHLEDLQSTMILAILTAWVITAIILYFSDKIQKVLGESGLMACERLIGMVIVLISVQRFLEGILLFWTTQPTPK
jgi:multiple antibiotic resistance protein